MKTIRFFLYLLAFCFSALVARADDLQKEYGALAARVAQAKIDPNYIQDQYVLICVQEALKAAKDGNYGVGACLVNGSNYSKIEIQDHNHVFMPYHRGDLHAEMTVLLRWDESQKAAKEKPSLKNFTLYTSVEPCVMCTARVIGSGVGSCLYAADDPGAGMIHLRSKLPPTYQKHMEGRTFERAKCSEALRTLANDIYQFSFRNLGHKIQVSRADDCQCADKCPCAGRCSRYAHTNGCTCQTFGKPGCAPCYCGGSRETYESIVEDCNRRGITLVVWVRQPGRILPRQYRNTVIDGCPDIKGQAVVIRRPMQEKEILYGPLTANQVLEALNRPRFINQGTFNQLSIPCRT